MFATFDEQYEQKKVSAIGLKDELESIEKEYEDKTTVMYREALDQVYAVSRQVAEKRREDGVEEAEHNQAIRTLEQNQVTLTKVGIFVAPDPIHCRAF